MSVPPFTVQAGRSDVIADAAMYIADPDMRKRRATYVCEAVNRRNVKSEETTTIPISRSDNDVDTLLKARQSDETIVAETGLNDLEEQINEVVYNMFGITLEEQKVIEEYLNTFQAY